MTTQDEARLTFHKHTFFELSAGGRTLFVDPVFSEKRRGRRLAGEIRSADYVLATSVHPWFEDVLDVLEATEATFVASPQVCRHAKDELGLGKKRLLDLEPWERASETGLRITALPIAACLGFEGAIDDGASILRDVSNVFPGGARIPIIGSLLPMLEGTARRTMKTFGGAASSLGPLDRFSELAGMDAMRMGRGRAGLGFLFEIEGYPSVLHLADGVHRFTRQGDLEEIAELCTPDILVMQCAGKDLEPAVRAVRALGPKTVIFYRANDPYATGRGETLPAGSFIAAVEEGAPECEALLLRPGDNYVLERAASVGAP